jgi:hypothetical protein
VNGRRMAASASADGKQEGAKKEAVEMKIVSILKVLQFVNHLVTCSLKVILITTQQMFTSIVI